MGSSGERNFSFLTTTKNFVSTSEFRKKFRFLNSRRVCAHNMSSREKHAVILLPKGWTEFLMTELRHPRTQKGHLFAFNGDKTNLCEVVCVNDPHSAWFIGNTIESDGRMQMLTPMDPLLLAIPYLRAAERSVPLDDLLIDDDYSEIGDIIGILTREKLEKIATPKGSPDLNVWKWDEEKCLDYLATKVKKLKT